MESSEFLSTVSALHGEAHRRGLFFQNVESQALRGREIQLDGRPMLSFSSCSYLGLERHPALVAGVIDAVQRWGTQFSSSRGYLSVTPYAELEAGLSTLFGGHALVTASTSIGHQVAFGVLATEKDAIVLDHQVHHSVQMAANLARANGARVEIVRHNDAERAIAIVSELAKSCRTVWYAADGVFSMYGDLAPVKLLQHLLELAPNVRLYIDDAHGMSWAGRHGRGSFLSRMPLTERMVLATSLNKAFSAGGGCLVLPTAEERALLLRCGGPMAFSGPLQPPMLGAALASMRLHLSDEITVHQESLRERTQYTNALLAEHALPLLVENEAPIFFVRMGLPRVAFAVAERMKADGIFVTVSAYPSVPMKRAGIRLAITAAHSFEDIARCVGALARHVPAVLQEERIGVHELDELFKRALPEESRPAPLGELCPLFPRTSEPDALAVELYDTIHALDKVAWDGWLGTVGSCSWDALALQERLFRDQPLAEHNWTFRYLIVRDRTGRVVAATFFSTFLNKDDMLMREEISQAVEARRRADPYFLTSTVVSLGSAFSEGNHLYLDRDGPWEAALARVIEVLSQSFEASQAASIVLRDLPGDDLEMDQALMARGFVKVPMLDSHHLEVDWTTEEAFLARLSRRKRQQMREILDQSRHFERRIYRAADGSAAALSADEATYLYELYRNVADAKRKLNVFPLPPSLVAGLLTSPAWEIVAFHLPVEAGGPLDGRPVAWYAAHRSGAHYAPFLCGLDYRYVYSHGAYRAMLAGMVWRTNEIPIRTIHMGMDADTEKSRLGTRVLKNCIYVQARDHFHGELLREIVANVGMDSIRRSA